jgi:phthiocerol/phenolphthiocerol synthesis type-I polyketide synthase E
LSTTLTISETSERDDVRRRLGLKVEDILLAALSRTIAATSGNGIMAVDLGGPGRSVLRPDVDLHRTVGWFTMIYPVALRCSGEELSAAELFADVHATLDAVPHYGIGYGLLRYLYAPTAQALGALRPPDIFISNAGTIPDLAAWSSDDAPVQFDTDAESPVSDAIPGLGHAIELRVYRSRGQLHLDWWRDSRRIDQAAAESLAAGFAASLAGLIQEVTADDESDTADDAPMLVDLS